MGVAGASRSLRMPYVAAPIAFRNTGTCLPSGTLFATKKICALSRYAENELSSGLNSSSFPSVDGYDMTSGAAEDPPDGVAIVRAFESNLVASCWITTRSLP